MSCSASFRLTSWVLPLPLQPVSLSLKLYQWFSPFGLVCIEG